MKRTLLEKLPKSLKKNDCGVVFQENAYNDLMKVYELITLVLPHLKKKRESAVFTQI